MNRVDTFFFRQRHNRGNIQVRLHRPFTCTDQIGLVRDADVQRLFGIVEPYLPKQPWFYEEDALTDRSEKFLASEIIREKLFRLTGDELPYTSTVVIDKFEDEGELRCISASIVVERDAHKGMVIGNGDERLKRIAWWNWPDEVIFARLADFRLEQIEQFCDRYDPVMASSK